MARTARYRVTVRGITGDEGTVYLQLTDTQADTYRYLGDRLAELGTDVPVPSITVEAATEVQTGARL